MSGACWSTEVCQRGILTIPGKHNLGKVVYLEDCSLHHPLVLDLTAGVPIHQEAGRSITLLLFFFGGGGKRDRAAYPSTSR